MTKLTILNVKTSIMIMVNFAQPT